MAHGPSALGTQQGVEMAGVDDGHGVAQGGLGLGTRSRSTAAQRGTRGAREGRTRLDAGLTAERASAAVVVGAAVGWCVANAWRWRAGGAARATDGWGGRQSARRAGTSPTRDGVAGRLQHVADDVGMERPDGFFSTQAPTIARSGRACLGTSV